MSVTFIDYYKVLGVDRNATRDEIRRAYRALAKKFHPDVSKAPDADARFKEINEAYEVLGDPEKRKRYDTLGANYQHGAEFQPPPGFDQWFGGGHPGPRPDFSQTEDVSDFFSTIFGDIFGGRAGGHVRGQRGFSWGGGASARGQDIETELSVTLEEAFVGGPKRLSLYRHDNGGAPRTIQVNLPKGVKDGARLRLAGQGEPGPAGGKGDLILVIRHRSHPLFRVEDAHVHVTVPVAPWELVLGAKVDVPTLEGSLRVTVPKGSQSGARLRLRGKGWPKDGGRGNLIVTLEARVPTTPTPEDLALWEQLANHTSFDPRAEFGR